MNEYELAQFEAALARLLDGEPEPGDGVLLARAMCQDSALRREVRGLFAVDDLLRQNAELSADDFAEAFAERLAGGADQGFIRRVRSALPCGLNSRWRSGRWFATAAAMIAVVAVLTFHFSRGPQPEVATLLLAEKCTWQEPGFVQEGRRLAVGPLRLRQGLAVLRFDGGAELILRGDTEIELQSAVQARLLRGKVTVRAPEVAAGFRLLTPPSEVVDLGTEFAAKVERYGATELHVMEGEVLFSPAAVRGHRGKILHAGKAVRFDNATVLTPRELRTSADRFDEIIRAARLTSCAELMFAYEAFFYRPGLLPPAEGKGGHGWRGPWRVAAKNKAYFVAEDSVTDLTIVHDEANMPWPVPGGGQPGMLRLPVGTTSLVRTLERPIALDEDGVFYFCFIVREPEFAAGTDEWQFGGVRLVFGSSANAVEDRISFGPTRTTRQPGIRMGNGPNFSSPLQIARNQNTLWIGKIIARRKGDDEIFFSIYGERDTVDYAEPATWQVATRGIRRNGRLDIVVIGGQLPTPCVVDELCIGPTWRSVAPVQELPEVRK